MKSISSVKVIINARSGFSDKEEVRRRLTEIFAASGDSEVLLAEGGDEVAQLAKQAAQEKWAVVAAGGGDGTINTVASHVIGTDKTIASCRSHPKSFRQRLKNSHGPRVGGANDCRRLCNQC